MDVEYLGEGGAYDTREDIHKKGTRRAATYPSLLASAVAVKF